MATRYSSGLFAPMPAPGYPAVDIFGAGVAQPGNGGGSIRSTTDAVLPKAVQANHAIAILAVVLVGFGLYWYARKG